MACPKCQSLWCEHCPKNDYGPHDPDGYSARQADGVDFTVDFWCNKCGQSGSVAIKKEDIQW